MPYHSTANAEPVPLAALRTAVTKVRADFQDARYDRMAASLPALIATATATRDHAHGHERATTSTLLADAYITAASFRPVLDRRRRGHHQWGKPEPFYRAPLSAERAAPAEVSYRPPVHRMTKDLLRADRRQSLPGLRAFAHRIGVPDA